MSLPLIFPIYFDSTNPSRGLLLDSSYPQSTQAGLTVTSGDKFKLRAYFINGYVPTQSFYVPEATDSIVFAAKKRPADTDLIYLNTSWITGSNYIEADVDFSVSSSLWNNVADFSKTTYAEFEIRDSGNTSRVTYPFALNIRRQVYGGENFSGSYSPYLDVSTALANYVNYNVTQSLSTLQKNRVKTNCSIIDDDGTIILPNAGKLVIVKDSDKLAAVGGNDIAGARESINLGEEQNVTFNTINATENVNVGGSLTATSMTVDGASYLSTITSISPVGITITDMNGNIAAVVAGDGTALVDTAMTVDVGTLNVGNNSSGNNRIITQPNSIQMVTEGDSVIFSVGSDGGIFTEAGIQSLYGNVIVGNHNTGNDKIVITPTTITQTNSSDVEKFSVDADGNVRTFAAFSAGYNTPGADRLVITNQGITQTDSSESIKFSVDDNGSVLAKASVTVQDQSTSESFLITPIGITQTGTTFNTLFSIDSLGNINCRNVGIVSPVSTANNVVVGDGTVTNANANKLLCVDSDGKVKVATLATNVQAEAGTSTTLVPSVSVMMDAILCPQVKRNFSQGGWIKATSGTAIGTINEYGMEMVASNTGVGYVLFYARIHNQVCICRGKGKGIIDFSKRNGFGATLCISSTLDSNNTARLTVGKIPTTDLAGNLARSGYGIVITSARKVEIQVHNGTTLVTTSNSTFTATVGQAFDAWIEINSGTANLYVNDTLVATTSGAPTIDSTSTANGFVLELQTSATSTVAGEVTAGNFAQYIGR